MRTLALLVASVLLSCSQLRGQTGAEPAEPSFQLLRSDEDYSFLKNDPAQRGFWKKLKWMPLGEKNFLSIGGESRSQFQVLKNENWELGNDDVVLFQRFMLHTDWHFGRRFRLFGQLKSGFAWGRNTPVSPLDEDKLDLHQLFAGIRPGRHSTVEIGRRELRYGSRRLIDVREGTNVRQSFDGVRWIWQKPGRRFDVFLYAYNPTRTGVFDNKFDTGQLLWGGYFVWNTASTNFDFYYLGVDNESPRFEEGSEPETRHSFGLRHWGQKGRFRYNNEAVFQTGTFGEGNITAWTLSTELCHTLPGKIKPVLGLKTEIISGDRNNGDGDLNTFNPLYPRGGYFGLLALIGPANLIDVHPSLAFSFSKKWSLNLDWDFFWRHQLDDGIYFPSGRLNVAGSGSRERFNGHQPGAQLTFAANPFLELEASFFYFQPGKFLKEITEGKPYSQAGISASFKF